MPFYRLISLLLPLLPASVAAAPPPTRHGLQLRVGGPAITVEEARRLRPEALGEILLAASHLPVTEAEVGTGAGEPPPPPGMPVSTRIRLYLQPVRSSERGFCERQVATVYLKPVDYLSYRKLPASTPDRLSTDVIYRWAEGKNPAVCPARSKIFFNPGELGKQPALSAVRALAKAVNYARHHRHLPFTISLNDEEGPEFLKWEKSQPKLGPIPERKVFSDPREALTALQPDAVLAVSQPYGADLTALVGRDRATAGSTTDRQIATLFVNGDWTVGLALRKGRITIMQLTRRIPAPF